MIQVFYTRKPIISLSHEYILEWKTNDGVSRREDVRVSCIALMEDPLPALAAEACRLAGELVELLPSEFETKLSEHVADPKNWPTQEDCNCTCSHGLFGSCHD